MAWKAIDFLPIMLSISIRAALLKIWPRILQPQDYFQSVLLLFLWYEHHTHLKISPHANAYPEDAAESHYPFLI